MALQLNQKSLELDLLRENITSLQTERQKKEADVSVLQAQVEHLQQNIERARREDVYKRQPLGYVLGKELVTSGLSALLIPLAMLMGWFIIDAEPAVHILNKQVEELTSGAISAKAMGLSLSVAVALANGLAMVRVLTGLPILYFLLPGYAVALGLSFFVPRTFTAIAFDSGGVASGPLTATFMLPLAMGACTALGGNVMTDAFGLVALVAMMPLITVQVMGGIYVLKSRTKTDAPVLPSFGENEIIELWEAV